MDFNLTANKTCVVPILNPDSFRQLKIASLFYDQVSPLFHTTKFQAKRERFPISDHYSYSEEEKNNALLELEWLFDCNLLDCPDSDNEIDSDCLEDFKTWDETWIHRTKKGMHAWQSEVAYFHPEFINNLRGLPLIHNELDFNARLNFPRSTFEKGKLNMVEEIVLSKFPVLSLDTEWENILEWRNDSSAQIKLRRLKNWVNKVSTREELNPLFLREEIDCLLDDYEQYMKVIKMKYTYSTFTSIVKISGELLEDLLKLRLSKIAEIPFHIRERKILLDEAELSAPGRELAFIFSSKEHFA